jgi:hypothetical protein
MDSGPPNPTGMVTGCMVSDEVAKDVEEELKTENTMIKNAITKRKAIPRKFFLIL